MRSMCGVTLNDRLRNEVIREPCGIKEDVVTKSMLRWFGPVERMSESRLTKDINKADVSGNIGRKCPRRKYINDFIGEVLQ